MLLCLLISRECHAHNVVKFLMAKKVACKLILQIFLARKMLNVVEFNSA